MRRLLDPVILMCFDHAALAMRQSTNIVHMHFVRSPYLGGVSHRMLTIDFRRTRWRARFCRRARGNRLTIRIAHACLLNARPGHQRCAIRAAGPADTDRQNTSNEYGLLDHCSVPEVVAAAADVVGFARTR